MVGSLPRGIIQENSSEPYGKAARIRGPQPPRLPDSTERGKCSNLRSFLVSGNLRSSPVRMALPEPRRMAQSSLASRYPSERPLDATSLNVNAGSDRFLNEKSGRRRLLRLSVDRVQASCWSPVRYKDDRLVTGNPLSRSPAETHPLPCDAFVACAAGTSKEFSDELYVDREEFLLAVGAFSLRSIFLNCSCRSFR